MPELLHQVTSPAAGCSVTFFVIHIQVRLYQKGQCEFQHLHCHVQRNGYQVRVRHKEHEYLDDEVQGARLVVALQQQVIQLMPLGFGPDLVAYCKSETYTSLEYEDCVEELVHLEHDVGHLSRRGLGVEHHFGLVACVYH